MANCDNLFKEFNERIKLNSSLKSSLRISRNSLRDKVRITFKDKGGYAVKFFWQGSFAMNTIIAPKDSDYDVDDGIYIQTNSLPKESPAILHSWIVQAARDHTSIEPTDRNPCVRVHFADGHRVDLVLYHYGNSEHPKLAHKRDGWVLSDPKEFIEWFNAKCDDGGQLKRLVRYFKTWSDDLRGEMPKGLILTILATQNMVLNARDDIAFLETMKKIRATLNFSFICYRPTTPHEDLFAEYSATRKQYFLDRLDSFIRSGEQALEEPNQKDACPKWERHFGERFPCEIAEDSLEAAKSFSSPAFISSDARSA
jgi:hypothetical protein